MTSNRERLIRLGIEDALGVEADDELVIEIDRVLPSRWGLNTPVLTRACARAYALGTLDDRKGLLA